MEKSDYIQLIIDNISIFKISLPSNLMEFQDLVKFLESYEAKHIKVIAGFDKNLLNYFFNKLLTQENKDYESELEKLEQISYFIGPMGNLNYLSKSQIEYVLDKLKDLNLEDINEAKLSLIADEQLEGEFGNNQIEYSKTIAFENQLSSARFYLQHIGYEPDVIEKKLDEAKESPSKLDDLFNLPPKEIYNLPPELEQNTSTPSNTQIQNQSNNSEAENSDDLIEGYIQSIQQEISQERKDKVEEILQKIEDYIKEEITDNYKQVYKQIHPDRLNRAYKFLKDTKRKSKRTNLYLEWFFTSHLLENIELKVEHWQVPSHSTHGNVGVYTAGVSFARYDNIVKEFSDSKLSKVIKICRRILEKPTKKKIQKLGQDLIAETGFDEHLYFTD